MSERAAFAVSRSLVRCARAGLRRFKGLCLISARRFLEGRQGWFLMVVIPKFEKCYIAKTHSKTAQEHKMKHPPKKQIALDSRIKI